MSSKTVVIGGGIAGITAAYFERLAGRQVVMIEADSRVGGLLKSDFGFDRYFDYGTHVYSETGVSELDNFLFSTCNENNCNFHEVLWNGNYFNGILSSKNAYVDTSVLNETDYYRGCVELLSSADSNQKNDLRSFLTDRFGETFYQCIFKDVVRKMFGIPAEQLSTYSSNLFEFERVLAFDDATTKRLAQIDSLNSKLGFHTKGVAPTKKFYPKREGVGWLVSELINKLEQLDVDVQTSVKIESINEQDGNIREVITDCGIFEVDRLLWTLPRVLLMRIIGENPNSAPITHRNTGLFDFVFQSPLNSDLLYINVYDTDFLSCRITLYQNLTRSDNYSCTVEVLTDNDVDLAAQTDKILSELIKMELVGEQNTCLFRQFRTVGRGFPVLTIEAVESDTRLFEYCSDYFKNVEFLGRSPNVFFMTDILIDAYNKTKQ